MDEAMDEAMQRAENCDRWMKRTTEKKGMFKYNPFSCFGVLHKGDCYYCLTLLGLSPEPKAMRLPVHELMTLHKNTPFIFDFEFLGLSFSCLNFLLRVADSADTDAETLVISVDS